MATTNRTTNTAEKVVALRIPASLDDKANQAAEKVHLRKADVFRLAIDRGIDLLLDQLSSKPAA